MIPVVEANHHNIANDISWKKCSVIKKFTLFKSNCSLSRLTYEDQFSAVGSSENPSGKLIQFVEKTSDISSLHCFVLITDGAGAIIFYTLYINEKLRRQVRTAA